MSEKKIETMEHKIEIIKQLEAEYNQVLRDLVNEHPSITISVVVTDHNLNKRRRLKHVYIETKVFDRVL